MSERAVLSIAIELHGERPAMTAFARSVVDEIKKMGAQESAIEVNVDSSLTRSPNERSRSAPPANRIPESETAPPDPDALTCAICDESLKGKRIVTINGGRLACYGCSAGREEAAA